MSEKIRFAVVGAGHIGKRHATMIQQDSESQLVAMADTNSTLEKEITGSFNVPFFNSIEHFLASGIECDVVNICTPNNLHSPLALTALEAGKHVVLEIGRAHV